MKGKFVTIKVVGEIVIPTDYAADDFEKHPERGVHYERLIHDRITQSVPSGSIFIGETRLTEATDPNQPQTESKPATKKTGKKRKYTFSGKYAKKK